MSPMFRRVAAPFVLLLPFVVPAQTTSTPERAKSAPQSDQMPGWLPVSIPASLYDKWKKYGEWDYKEQGSKYRDYTFFNFGATGSAAGLDQTSLMALSRASKPTPEDAGNLDKSDLASNFARNRELLDELRGMAEQDKRVIRIANTFTWLADNTKWPRGDLGFSNERWNEYRTLFSQLSSPEGIFRTEDFPGSIFFVAYSRGLCTGGSSSGYVYSSATLTPIVESPPKKALDREARANSNRHYAYVFKSLKDNWYTFYEVDW